VKRAAIFDEHGYALQATCPKCKASPGARCVSIASNPRRSMYDRVHVERIHTPLSFATGLQSWLSLEDEQ
jgi:hypothetical protein